MQSYRQPRRQIMGWTLNRLERPLAIKFCKWKRWSLFLWHNWHIWYLRQIFKDQVDICRKDINQSNTKVIKRTKPPSTAPHNIPLKGLRPFQNSEEFLHSKELHHSLQIKPSKVKMFKYTIPPKKRNPVHFIAMYWPDFQSLHSDQNLMIFEKNLP